MRVLGIESSCDETAIAIVKGEGDVLSVETSLVSSQIDLHKAFGGVIPEVAARRHVDVIFPLLQEAGIPRDGQGIDAIAVTSGPGLVAALRVGVELGKTLAWMWHKPLVGANHLEGHIYSTWFAEPQPSFPALALLVSGGHTELVLMKDHGRYELLGMTRDDAAGEAFDKVAKLVGLEYPGGPKISALAKEGNPHAIPFPRPMLDSDNLDFSFSGLKTAVAVYLEKNVSSPQTLSSQGGEGVVQLRNVCASFQQAVVDVLVSKTLKAVAKHQPKSVLLSGGVAANALLRETLARALAPAFLDVTFHAPSRDLTTDNAAMIAAAGYFRARAGRVADPFSLQADPSLRLA